MLEIKKGKIYLHPLLKPIASKMDRKKFEKMGHIKNYLENDDLNGLTKYIDRIKPTVKKDEDFQDIFDEVKNKNYDQALFLVEEYAFNSDDPGFEDNFDKDDLNHLSEKDVILMDEPGDNYEDFIEDITDDFSEDQFDDLPYYED